MKVKLRNPDRTAEVSGPAPVSRVLEQLSINPETVLVIHDGTLVTKDAVIPDDAEVEIRSVISGGAGPARCSTDDCRVTAVLEVARHRASYCAEHFVDHVRSQVRDAISRHEMLSYNDRILVAVSGGKDSLALWDVLLDMGYAADGLYLGLGIGEYSDRSGQMVQAYAAKRGARLHQVDLAQEHGYAIPQATTLRNRSSCGVCGLSKRYVFNRVALEHGYDVMATGHNLDDEAAQLMGNVLRWQTPFMARQSMVLPASEAGMARKVKPLYRLGEREMAAYCVVKGIDYVVEECPMVEGNTQHRYKEALTMLEETSPGTKHQMYFGFLKKAADRFSATDEDVEVVPCVECGSPTVAWDQAEPRCSFCKTKALATRRKADGTSARPPRRRRHRT